MTKSRFNLRNVAAIAACLVVSVLFLSFDENTDNSATSGEDSDKVLIGGSWMNSSSSGMSLISNIYFFYENGTFKYNRTSTGNSYGYIVEGKYSTSKGTMYLTDLKFYTSDKIDKKEKWADKTFEYSIVKENKFYYLTIKSLGNYEGYSKSMVPVRFSKSAE